MFFWFSGMKLCMSSWPHDFWLYLFPSLYPAMRICTNHTSRFVFWWFHWVLTEFIYKSLKSIKDDIFIVYTREIKVENQTKRFELMWHLEAMRIPSPMWKKGLNRDIPFLPDGDIVSPSRDENVFASYTDLSIEWAFSLSKIQFHLFKQ